MRDQSLQPSQIVFPVSLHPEERETAEEGAGTPHVAWGWLEIFVLVQVLWGVLLFVPGSQAYRVYIRGFPYISSLIALFACLRSSRCRQRHARCALDSRIARTDGRQPRSSVDVVHVGDGADRVSVEHRGAGVLDRPQLGDGRAPRARPPARVRRELPRRGCSASCRSTTRKRSCRQSSAGSRSDCNAELVGSLTYIGADGREILRPPGLSDIPGGAAVSATITALLGFAFATRAEGRTQRRVGFLAAALIGLTVVYLTQIRSMLVMVCVCMMAAGAVRLRQGRVAHTTWIAGSAGAARRRLVYMGGRSWRRFGRRAFPIDPRRRRRPELSGKSGDLPQLHAAGTALRISVRRRHRTMGNDDGVFRRPVELAVSRRCGPKSS